MTEQNALKSTKPTSKVEFMSSGNYCELNIESRDNLYIARFWRNGDFEYAHNCYKVPALPVSPLSVILVAAITEYRELIRCYMATDDVQTRNELFWSIKRKLDKAQT